MDVLRQDLDRAVEYFDRDDVEGAMTVAVGFVDNVTHDRARFSGEI